MKKKLFVLGMPAKAMVIAVLALGLAVAGCTSAPKAAKAPIALSPKLEASLSKYMGPQPQTWGPDDDRYDVDVYYLDPLRFEAFKAELDASGEYVQDGNGNYTREWDRGKTFARLGVRSDGGVELTLAKANNSTSEYMYTKDPQASGLKVDELLRKYMVSTDGNLG